MTLFGTLSQNKFDKAEYSILYSRWNDLQWTIELYMGQFFKMDVILDTATDWLLIEGATCTNCDGNTYDI